MKTWQPPLIVLALIVSMAIGFVLGGPGFGIMFVGLGLVALVVALLAVASKDPMGRTPHPELNRRLLIVTTFPIEDSDTIQVVADMVGLGGVDSESSIRVLTPADNSFLRRWATDLKDARERAQSRLVVSIASLTLAGVDADAKVGDENLVQAVEDELRTYDATEVFLLTSGTPESPVADVLSERLQPDFVHLDLAGGAGKIVGFSAHPSRFSR